MRSLRRAALLLPLLALGCEGPLLSGYVEVPRFGLYLASEEIPGTGGLDPSQYCEGRSDCMVVEFELPFGEQVDLEQPGATIDLRLSELSLHVVSDPPPDLSHVVSVKLYAMGGAAPVLLAAYARDPANPSPVTVTAKGNADSDLLPMIEAGIIDLRAEITTDGPTPTFLADVEAVFYLKIQVDYLEALKGTP